MSIFSVFNAPSVPGVMVTNWDSVATAQLVSKAADKVVGAVKDGAKQIVDVGKNSQKVVDAVKQGSDKIIDAVGKIKVANSAMDNQQSVSPTMQTVHTGFRSVAATTARIADSILECPAEAKVAVDRARGVHTQYGSMIETATRLCDDNEALRSTVSEVRKAEDWFSSQCNDGGQCTAVSNGGGAVRVFNSFQDVFLARSEQ